jgi:parvulin-like peptidyl-prolyl isomerase
MTRLFLIPLMLVAFLGAAADEYKPAIRDIKVNGELVSADAIGKIYAFWVKIYQAPSPKPLTKELLDQLAKVSREQAIRETAVRQYIEKNKLTLSPEQLKEDMELYKADLAADAKKQAELNKQNGKAAAEPKTFEELLKQNGKTEEDVAKERTNRFLVQRALAAEAEKNLEPYKKDFEEAKKKMALRRASQILFSYDKARFTSSNRTKEDAKKQADFTLERAKRGEDFDTLAKEVSDDKRTKEKGGDLDWTSPTTGPKPVADAVYALAKVGDISDVIESDIGFHILKLTDLKPEEQEFKNFLRRQIFIKALSFENKLGKDAKVEDMSAPLKE